MVISGHEFSMFRINWRRGCRVVLQKQDQLHPKWNVSLSMGEIDVAVNQSPLSYSKKIGFGV